jgi:hypothetical protein
MRKEVKVKNPTLSKNRIGWGTRHDATELLVGDADEDQERKCDLEMRGDANNAMGSVSEQPAGLDAN